MKGRFSVVDWLVLGSGLTLLSTTVAWWLKNRGASSECSSRAFRSAVVEAGMSEVGKAELDKYFADAAPQYVGSRPEWCGIFCLWALHQAGLGKGVQWKVALGFLEPQRLPHVSNPQIGDIAYVHTPYRHEAIVREVRGDEIDLINGNGAGGVVSLSTTDKSKVTTFYSIQPWVDAAVKECSS